MTDQQINVLIATYLEPEHVERIRAVDERLHVLYEPELLGAPRYPADHYNLPQRTPAQEAHRPLLVSQGQDRSFEHDAVKAGEYALDRLPEPRYKLSHTPPSCLGEHVAQQQQVHHTGWWRSNKITVGSRQ